MAEDWKQRVINEKAELDEKIAKLDSFLESEKGKQLTSVDGGLLMAQYSSMLSYSLILDERIKRFQ